MLPYEHFRHCPACGSTRISVAGKKLACGSCTFTYYFNPTIGTAGFIENPKGEILLIKRGKEPAKGRLAPPGGFADYRETAEEALSREVREETGIRVEGWEYISSEINWYSYQGVTYPVIDFFYQVKLDTMMDPDPCSKETAGVAWIALDEIDADQLAFPSMQKAFRRFLHHRGPRS